MSDNINQLINYEKENFFQKIKRKIISLFSKTKNTEDDDIYEIKNMIQTKEENTQKKEFFTIYNKVKDGSIDLSDLSEDMLYKVMVMLDEEMSANSRRIDDKMKLIDISINKIKMSNSGLKLLKKKF